MERLVLDVDRCKACELCVSVCPKDILRLSDDINKQGYHPVECTDPEQCTSCAMCARMCPDVVISVYRPD